MHAAFALDTVEINARPHLIYGRHGKTLTVAPYSSRSQVEIDLIDKFAQVQKSGGRPTGNTESPVVLRLASPNGRKVAVLATLHIAQGCYLVTGEEGQELEADLHESRISRDCNLAKHMAGLTSNGWTIKH